MKIFCLLLLFFSTACSPPAAKGPVNVKSEAELKTRLRKLAAEKRADKAWMTDDDCPADIAPISSEVQFETHSCKEVPESCEAECEDGKGNSCFALASLLEKHNEADEDVSNIYYRKACRLGVASGCTNASAKLNAGSSFQTRECQARTYEYSCKREDPWGCTMLGAALAQGQGVPKDVDGAIAAFAKACEYSSTPTFDACQKAMEMKESFSKGRY